MENFIEKYFGDVIEYMNNVYFTNYEKFVTKVSDNRFIINMQDEADRELFQQNVLALKLIKNPIYDENRHNHYCTLTYYPDNDKIIVKEVIQELLDRHKINLDNGDYVYVKDRTYYKRTCYKTIITKQGILNCYNNKRFKRMGYYSYGNSLLGYGINNFLSEPDMVFNRILKDINLYYRPDMEWTYAPRVYELLANSENSLKLAKKLNKIWNPGISCYHQGKYFLWWQREINSLRDKHRINQQHLQSINEDELPF